MRGESLYFWSNRLIELSGFLFKRIIFLVSWLWAQAIVYVKFCIFRISRSKLTAEKKYVKIEVQINFVNWGIGRDSLTDQLTKDETTVKLLFTRITSIFYFNFNLLWKISQTFYDEWFWTEPTRLRSFPVSVRYGGM